MSAADHSPPISGDAVEKAFAAANTPGFTLNASRELIGVILAAAAPDLTADAITAERERIAAAIGGLCTCVPDDHLCEYQKAARIARAGGQT